MGKGFIKKLNILNLIFLMMLSFALSSNILFANTLTVDDIEKQIIMTVTNELKLKGYEDVNVSVLNMPILSLYSKNGVYKVVVSKGNNGLNQREFRQVRILKNGMPVKTFGVPLEIKAYKYVLCANDTITKESPISYNNVYVKRVNVSKFQDNVLDKKSLNGEIIANKMFRRDEILDKRFVKYKPDISKNDKIEVIFKNSNGLFISIDAIALTNGNIGDLVNVKNSVYNKIYTGKVVSKNRVQIEI